MSADSVANSLCNPGLLLRDFAEKNSAKLAIASPLGQLSYGEFEARSDDIAFALLKAGIKQGDKIILMIKPSIDLYSIAFGLVKIGAIPVVVDPGMGLKRMLNSYRSISARAFIGITPAQIVRILAPRFFKTVEIVIWVRASGLFDTHGKSLISRSDRKFPIANTRTHDLSIINFTTGSTGPAKPVEATYGMIVATVRLIQEAYGQGPADVDMVTVPFFGIVALLIGSSVVIPPMNPAKPAEVDPQKIIDTITHYKVSTMLASPALLSKVGQYAAQHGIKLPTLRVVNSGGAPISLFNLEQFTSLLSGGGRIYSSWGATEGLPLATISGEHILKTFRDRIQSGRGSPVGRVLPGIQAKIIKISSDPIKAWNNQLEVAPGTIGEVVVEGPNISRSYHLSPESNAAHKISADGSQAIWHRTGDLAWQDTEGHLFFCGRKTHSFLNKQGMLMHSVACEGVANIHPKVKRSALVGVDALPVLCLELNEPASVQEQEQIKNEVREILKACDVTKSIDTILIHRKFPVDLRHNAKIERPLLAIWAKHCLKPQNQAIHLAKLIPILGWVYIAFGLISDLPPGFWTIIWWIDLFLSTVVHIMQIPEGIRIGAIHGFSTKESALRTFIFGATWWKPLRPTLETQG